MNQPFDLDGEDFALSEDWGVDDTAKEESLIKMAPEADADEESADEKDLSPVLPPAAFEDGVVDVSTFDFQADVMQRIKSGPTLQSFSDTAAIWTKYLHLLPPYNEAAIRAEIASWNLDIPSKDEFYFEPIMEAYARQVSYRNRLTQLSGVVNAHHQMLDQAHRNLREIAMKLSSGPKHDKDAHAAYVTQSLQVTAACAGQLARYLDQVLRSIDFAAVQIDRLMKERQALARINHSYVNEGQSSSYQRQKLEGDAESPSEPRGSQGAPAPAPPRPRPTIPTRNHRIGR